MPDSRQSIDELQSKIRGMVLELIDAMRRCPDIPNCRPYNPSEIVEITDALPGIKDGTFFNRLPEDQHGLGWVNGAFFGRGERAIPLFISGVLRADFDQEFGDLLHEYWSSEVFPQRESTPPEMERVNRKLAESKAKAKEVRKVKMGEQVGGADAEESV
ncbi:hypothetical protein [Luteolibacter sp. AS25]|uniref:hypothetical protein n=1 Tax=Luteolibacter sp. AS25 TaxID=3135776 RepID=UPI00398AA3FC